MDNRISLYKLEVFCAVVEQGGVGRAAAQLHISQPVVSGHIRSLEERLSVGLFHRTSQGLELTDAGHATYRWSRDTLRRSTELDRELAGLTEGTAGAAAIATSMTVGTYLLPPIVTDFVQAHPAARITTHVFDPNQIWDAVTSGLCDLGVPIAPRIPYGRGLTGELIGHQELVLIARPGTPTNFTEHELAELPFISTPRTTIRREIEDAAFSELGITDRNVITEFGHPEAIKHAVRTGLGVALLFRASVSDDLARGSLQEIRIPRRRPRVPIFTVWRTGKRLSPMQRNLTTLIRNTLSS